MANTSNRPYGVNNHSSDPDYRTRLFLAPLNGALTTTPIVFDLRNWSGQYISLHCDGTDAYIQFSDMEIAVIDETATLTVAPVGPMVTPTECCFKVAEGSTVDVFVHPRFPFLHCVRAYPLDGYMRIVKS